MSSQTMIGLLLGLSTAFVACGAEPAGSTPHVGSAGGMAGSAGAGTSSGNAAGTANTAFGGSPATGGTSDGAAGSLGGAGSSNVAGSSGMAGTSSVNMVDPCVPLDSLKALPLAVDGPFIPGGYFWDRAFPDNATAISHAACDTRSDAATHYGSCHKWSFLPAMLGVDPASMTMKTYGGVFWLAGSASNWGTAAGVNIAPGAQTVKFRAWGAVGGEIVTFSVGGVSGATCLDSVNFGTAGGMKVTLTTTPTDYVFDLRGQTYPKGVIGAFSWSTENSSTTVPVVFNVDDIRWTADAP